MPAESQGSSASGPSTPEGAGLLSATPAPKSQRYTFKFLQERGRVPSVQVSQDRLVLP